MMQGEVNSPGCYLEAKEILKRHFFAFCIDEWTKSDYIKNSIPPNFRLKPFQIEFLDLNDQALFFNRIISFIKAQEAELYKKFIINNIIRITSVIEIINKCDAKLVINSWMSFKNVKALKEIAKILDFDILISLIMLNNLEFI